MRQMTSINWSKACLQTLLFTVFLVAIMTGLASRVAFAAAVDGDARAFFNQFVAAQNAHDTAAVGALLWDSPDMLWFTRGVEVRGKQKIVDTLVDYYSGTWHLEPDMAAFRATELAPGVTQILVPISFTRGLPGKVPQANTFLISQTLVRGSSGWRVVSILPIANTQFK